MIDSYINYAALGATYSPPSGLPRATSEEEINNAWDELQSKPKIIPKGCREYRFGGFTCIATTEKKAVEKYQKHLNSTK